MAAWDDDEFVLDPSRITLSIGRTGYDGDTFKREQLMDRHGVQINKTSRNTVLFMTNIGTTRSSVAFLVEVSGEDRRRTRRGHLRDESRRAGTLRENGAAADTNVRCRCRTSADSTRCSATTAVPSRHPRVTCGARSTCPTTTPTAST